MRKNSRMIVMSTEQRDFFLSAAILIQTVPHDKAYEVGSLMRKTIMGMWDSGASETELQETMRRVIEGNI